MITDALVLASLQHSFGLENVLCMHFVEVNIYFEKIFNFLCPRTDNVDQGPCSAFGTCFLLSHPGIKDQEHTIKHAVEKEYSCITSN